MVSKTIKTLAVAAAAFMVITPATSAADDTNITVAAGSLTITTAPTAGNFSTVTLDGTAKQTTATLDDFEVNDSRGSGAGWHVTISATQFAEHDGTDYVTNGKTLATGSLALEQLTVAQDGTTSNNPTITSGPYTIDAGSAVSVASAATGDGMGKYDFSAADNSITMTLSVPASAYAKTYRSEVTVDVISGP